MARDRLRQLLEHRLGAPGRAILAWRTRGRAEALLARRGLAEPAARVAHACRDTVARGPFAGLEYPRRRGDIVHAAKLLGAYERELHAAIERCVARAPRRVVNIGSGDGYYVVGLARRLPHARVVAVDPDPIAQRACARTAARNGVGARIDATPRVDTASLQRLLADGAPALVVADCEGCEDDLVDVARVPAIAAADLLIETHDFAAPGVTARLTDRLAPTHDVVRIDLAPRDVSAYPELAALPPAIAAGLLDEFRHVPQAWLACSARHR